MFIQILYKSLIWCLYKFHNGSYFFFSNFNEITKKITQYARKRTKG